MPKLFPWTPSRKPPPSHTRLFSPTHKRPVSCTLISPNSSSLLLSLPPSSRLQPLPTLSHNLSFMIMVEGQNLIEHDHTYCRSKQQEKLSVSGTNEVLLTSDHDNTPVGKANIDTQYVSLSLCIITSAVLYAIWNFTILQQ